MQLYEALINSPSIYSLSFEFQKTTSSHKSEQTKRSSLFAFFNTHTIAPTMNILTNNSYSNIDVTSIMLMKLVMREQQSRASMVNFQDYQTETSSMCPIRTACSPSTSKVTGGIGNWLKQAKFDDKHRASLLLGGGLRKESTMQQSRRRKGFPPLAATRKKRSLVKAHSMRTFRDQWSNGASRDQHVNREVFARKLQRGTLVVKTRK